MFGHQNDNDQPQPEGGGDPIQAVQAPEGGAEQPAQDTNQNTEEASQPNQGGQPDATGYGGDAPAGQDAADSQDVGQNPEWQQPGNPAGSQEQISDVISPAGGYPQRPSYQYPAGSKPVPPEPTGTDEDPALHELLDVKTHALEELAPLLDKLDLPPEEKFRAIMMILQANDDKNLVKLAYETAHAIEDEETRARALYTIVNEVDYFTHPQDQGDA